MAQLPTLNLHPGALAGSNVEFTEPPKAAIARSCVSVPWRLYGERAFKLITPVDPVTKERMPRRWIETAPRALPHVYYYLLNVLSDTRLGDLSSGYAASLDVTASSPVQDYARKVALDRRAGSASATQDDVESPTTWVMEYVDSSFYARHCLVPQNAVEPLDRVSRAIEHVETYMTDDSIANTRRPEAQYEQDEEDEAGKESFVWGEDTPPFPPKISAQTWRAWFLKRLRTVKDGLEKRLETAPQGPSGSVLGKRDRMPV